MFLDWLRRVKRTGAAPRQGTKPRRHTGHSFRPRVKALEDRCLLSGGVLDPTFGTAGIVTTTVTQSAEPFAVATYPSTGSANDGKIVAAGYGAIPSKNKYKPSYDYFAVVRYNLNGSLDTSFGGGTGQVLTNLGSGYEMAEDVTVQPDGKIVAVGFSGGQFALVRYNADGSLDTSFGGTGKILGNISTGSTDRALRVSLQADGKIIVAGISNGALFLERYNNSTLDTSFGTGGQVITQFPEGLDEFPQRYRLGKGFDMAIDPGTSAQDPNAGKIVIVGQTPLQNGFPGPVVVARYNTNGSLDTSFNGDGYVIDGSQYLASVAVQSDDRIVVAGQWSSEFNWTVALARFNVNGTPDTTFGSGGLVVTTLANNQLYPDAVTMQPDGRIVVGGTQSPYPGTSSLLASNFLLVRYNPTDGSLDTSFGNQGIAVSSGDVLLEGNPPLAMAAEPDGRIVLAGDTLNSTGGYGFALARFLVAGPQIGSFTASQPTAGAPVALTAAHVTDANPGVSSTQVTFYYFDSTGARVVLGAVAVPDSSGNWTLQASLPPGSYTLYAQAQDSDGVFGDPVALALAVQ
jgi:uncharacterized delta-60 repeat protein